MRVVSWKGDSAWTTMLAAQPAAVPPGAAAVLAQRVSLDQHGILRLQLLGRAVVGVAVVDADGGRHAVLGRLGAPAAAQRTDADDVELAVRRRLMPWMLGKTRSAWWPATTRSGMAFAIALKIVSITVIGKVIQTRIGDGRSALTTVPIGMMTFSERKLPSLTG